MPSSELGESETGPSPACRAPPRNLSQPRVLPLIPTRSCSLLELRRWLIYESIAQDETFRVAASRQAWYGGPAFSTRDSPHASYIRPMILGGEEVHI